MDSTLWDVCRIEFYFWLINSLKSRWNCMCFQHFSIIFCYTKNIILICINLELFFEFLHLSFIFRNWTWENTQLFYFLFFHLYLFFLSAIQLNLISHSYLWLSYHRHLLFLLISFAQFLCHFLFILLSRSSIITYYTSFWLLTDLRRFFVELLKGRFFFDLWK